MYTLDYLVDRLYFLAFNAKWWVILIWSQSSVDLTNAVLRQKNTLMIVDIDSQILGQHSHIE